jgi:hypothetical protein
VQEGVSLPQLPQCLRLTHLQQLPPPPQQPHQQQQFLAGQGLTKRQRTEFIRSAIVDAAAATVRENSML